MKIILNPKYEHLRDYLMRLDEHFFQTRKEHDVVQAHLAKQFKTAVTFEHTEAVGTNQDSRENHADYRRNAEAFQQHRGKENDGEDDEEYPGRVSNRHDTDGLD